MLQASLDLSSMELSLRASCPVGSCWARPQRHCKFQEEPGEQSPWYAIPKYHWARLERVERHVPGLARQVYLREIQHLRHIDLLAIAIRRMQHEWQFGTPLESCHLNSRISREELIRLLLPGAKFVAETTWIGRTG